MVFIGLQIDPTSLGPGNRPKQGYLGIVTPQPKLASVDDKESVHTWPPRHYF